MLDFLHFIKKKKKNNATCFIPPQKDVASESFEDENIAISSHDEDRSSSMQFLK